MNTTHPCSPTCRAIVNYLPFHHATGDTHARALSRIVDRGGDVLAESLHSVMGDPHQGPRQANQIASEPIAARFRRRRSGDSRLHLNLPPPSLLAQRSYILSSPPSDHGLHADSHAPPSGKYTSVQCIPRPSSTASTSPCHDVDVQLSGAPNGNETPTVDGSTWHLSRPVMNTSSPQQPYCTGSGAGSTRAGRRCHIHGASTPAVFDARANSPSQLHREPIGDILWSYQIQSS